MSTSQLREIPSVRVLIERPGLHRLAEQRGRLELTETVREVLDEARLEIVRGHAVDLDPSTLESRIQRKLAARGPALKGVLNATGILLHTGLGRAPLAQEALDAVFECAAGYCNLELDLETASRSQRSTGVEELIKKLCGAEAAAVVNNNAGATILALHALARNKEVVVSRGQLVEIGGQFRLPEIFEVSGAKLREVGTTNKTRLSDYEAVICSETTAILRVHSSNYKIVGFTESVAIEDLVRLGHARGLYVIDDIGSGAIDVGRPPGIGGEPTLAAGIAAGSDLVLCSGDKLLGGPQSGILAGTEKAVRKVQNDPLMRALRVDKMTLAALEATLRLALDPELGGRRIPLWSFLSTPLDALQARADRLAQIFRDGLALSADTIASTTFLGGGSMPQENLPSVAVRLRSPFPGGSVEAFARALRVGKPALAARIQEGALLLDLRTLAPTHDDNLISAIRAAACPTPRSP